MVFVGKLSIIPENNQLKVNLFSKLSNAKKSIGVLLHH